MQEKNLIAVKDFCVHHNIEISFLHTLREYGLINIISSEHDLFVDGDCLTELEKMMRLHYELDINMEGIEAIRHLLNKLENMQNEITMLKNKLRLYESLQ